MKPYDRCGIVGIQVDQILGILHVDGLIAPARQLSDASHNYGTKHIGCWFSDSHGASGLQGDSLTERRRNSDDKKKEMDTR